MSPTSVLIALILGGLLLQYTFGWRQARRFSRDITALRRRGAPDGIVSVGVGKHRGRRAYVAIVSDPAGKKVTSAMQMSGATVFASAQPCPVLVGQRLDRLVEGQVPMIRSVPLSRAAAQAASFALDHRQTSTVG